MSLFSDNIRHLRMKKEVSQEIVAESLSISRDILAKYEQGKSQAPYENLIKLSRYYHVSIDLLLTVDIRKIDMDGLIQLDDNRIVLPITVDQNGGNLIEIIPQKAKAGYLSGYSDPEFIESLQHIALPFLRNGKYRAFPIEGRSMPPFQEGSFIVGEYVEHLDHIKDGHTYIMLTKNDGIVYKRVYRKGKKFLFHSDNPDFEPYDVKPSQILEVWKYACGFTTTEYEADNLPVDTMKTLLMELKKDISLIKKKLP